MKPPPPFVDWKPACQLVSHVQIKQKHASCEAEWLPRYQVGALTKRSLMLTTPPHAYQLSTEPKRTSLKSSRATILTVRKKTNSFFWRAASELNQLLSECFSSIYRSQLPQDVKSLWAPICVNAYPVIRKYGFGHRKLHHIKKNLMTLALIQISVCKAGPPWSRNMTPSAWNRILVCISISMLFFLVWEKPVYIQRSEGTGSGAGPRVRGGGYLRVEVLAFDAQVSIDNVEAHQQAHDDCPLLLQHQRWIFIEITGEEDTRDSHRQLPEQQNISVWSI